MITVLSVASLCAGGGLAYASTRVPERTECYELWAGRLLIAGLVLVGAGMPFMR